MTKTLELHGRLWYASPGTLQFLAADFEQEAPLDVPWPSVVLMHYTKLSRILGRIGEGKDTGSGTWRILRREQRSIARNLDLDRIYWHPYRASRMLYPTGCDMCRTNFALTSPTLMALLVANACRSVCTFTRVLT